MADQLWTTTALAARWGCTTRTVNRMAQLRVLPALKRGRHWRFSSDAVAAYEAARTTAVTNESPAVRQAVQPTSPVLHALPDLPADYEPVFPELFPTHVVVSSATGRTRGADTKKRLSARN